MFKPTGGAILAATIAVVVWTTSNSSSSCSSPSISSGITENELLVLLFSVKCKTGNVRGLVLSSWLACEQRPVNQPYDQLRSSQDERIAV